MEALAELLRLLGGTVIHRPYVYAFFACYLCFAWPHLKARGCLLYTVLAYCVAFVCEYSSTRNGFPFGRYVYIDATRTRELWISNVPFWDSLSFVFLSYFSWIVAASVLSPRSPARALLRPAAALLGGVLMTALDVVIDPLTLLGDRWFLGKIYYYPRGGSYFGVTLSNFGGWCFVGTATILLFQALARFGWLRTEAWSGPSRIRCRAALGVYAGVFAFNLAITAWVGAGGLLAASTGVVLVTLAPCALRILPGRPREVEA